MLRTVIILVRQSKTELILISVFVEGQLVEEGGDLIVVGREVPLFQVPATEAFFIRRPTNAAVRTYIREYPGQLIILLATEQPKLKVDEVEEILHEKDGVWIPVVVGDHCFIYRKQ